ncbi:MAG: hypothetical protein Q4F74_02950 [Synergistaceae bacterium]|nr:hypothetical protein [Synergistaceae bacterium]
MNIEQLLDKLDEAQTNEEIREIGQEILAEDPQSPYGKLAVWETMEYEECVENLDTLYEALDTIKDGAAGHRRRPRRSGLLHDNDEPRIYTALRGTPRGRAPSGKGVR